MCPRRSIPLPAVLFTHAAPTRSTSARRWFLNWLRSNRHILLRVLESVRRNLISRMSLLAPRPASSEPRKGAENLSHKKAQRRTPGVFLGLNREYFVHFVPYCGY